MVSEEKIFSKSTNQKEEWPVAACLLTDQAEISNLYSEPSKDASYQVMIHLARRFRGEDILEINQSETKRPVAAMFANGSGRNKQSL